MIVRNMSISKEEPRWSIGFHNSHRMYRQFFMNRKYWSFTNNAFDLPMPREWSGNTWGNSLLISSLKFTHREIKWILVMIQISEY